MSKPEWIPFDNNFLVVAEFEHSQEDADKYNKGDRGGPNVMAGRLDEATTLRRAFQRATDGYSFKSLGRVTIARLIFEDIPMDLLMTELARRDEPT